MSRLRSDKVVNKAGTGAPELTYGAVVPATGTISGAGGINLTGIVTATSFSGPITGSGSNLTSLNASEVTTGTISNDRLPATITKNINSSGSNTLGTLTVTNDATVGGNLTVNGTTTTIDTVVTSVDRLEVDGDVSVGAALTAIGSITAAEFIKSDGTAVAGDVDITSCLFV